MRGKRERRRDPKPEHNRIRITSHERKDKKMRTRTPSFEEKVMVRMKKKPTRFDANLGQESCVGGGGDLNNFPRSVISLETSLQREKKWQMGISNRRTQLINK